MAKKCPNATRTFRITRLSANTADQSCPLTDGMPPDHKNGFALPAAKSCLRIPPSARSAARGKELRPVQRQSPS